MKRSKFSEQQTASILRQAEFGMTLFSDLLQGPIMRQGENSKVSGRSACRIKDKTATRTT